MGTTTLRMNTSLKRRIGLAAKKSGQTPHLYMLQAITEVVADHELRTAFEAEALARRNTFALTKKSLSVSQFEKLLRAVTRQAK
jgi:predicted transcriptional regulator